MGWTDSWAVQWNWIVYGDCAWSACGLSHVCWIFGCLSSVLFIGCILLRLHGSHDWSSFFKRSQIGHSEWVGFHYCRLFRFFVEMYSTSNCLSTLCLMLALFTSEVYYFHWIVYLHLYDNSNLSGCWLFEFFSVDASIYNRYSSVTGSGWYISLLYFSI